MQLNILQFHQRRAVALVITLCCLALLTAVMVAFLLGGTRERTSASSYANSAGAKRLGDTAVQIVMGQIRQATSGGASVAWASQPGMIRTFGDSSATSGGLAYYKLYSSDQMVVNQSNIPGFSFADDLSVGGSGTADWINKPAIFTDLNAPVLSASDRLEYPIIDPGAATAVSGTYSLVEGCAITNPPGFTSGSASAKNNPAPMPVKWLYMLRDGTVTAPGSVDGTGKVASWSGTSGIPTKDNPIVARIAFWTDDETCKLNLNTAVGNNYWDQPMFCTGLELQFDRYQPALHEYTRYPAHPSTTSLVPVFWSYGGLSSPDYNLFPGFTSPTTYMSAPSADPALSAVASDYFLKLMNLTPRNAWGGSLGGTVPTVNGTATSVSLSALDNDRLFASVDEIMFSPPRNSLTTSGSGQFQLAKSDIEKLRFFLSTTSRAPEVNMFNQPKVSMWPVHDISVKNPTNTAMGTGTSSRTPLDNILSFCSTVNGQSYYFTRNDPTSPTADLGGVTAGSQRNLALYNYLNGLMGKPIPGFGNSFQSRYGAVGDQQILTECYDYIRGCINLIDGSGPSSNSYLYAFANNPQGEVVPIIHPTNGTKGLGRFPTIKEVGLMFIARAANQPPVLADSAGAPILTSGTQVTINPMHPWIRTPSSATLVSGTNLNVTDSSGNDARYPTLSDVNMPAQTHAGMPYLTTINPATLKFDKPNPRYHSDVLPTTLTPGQTQIQALLMIDPVNNAVGFPPLRESYKIRVTFNSAFSANGGTLFSAGAAGSTQTVVPFQDMGSAFNYPLCSTSVTGSSAASLSNAKLLSVPVIVSSSTFAFSGGKLLIEVIADNGAVVQSVNVNFPSAAFPTPLLPIQPSDLSWGSGYNMAFTPNFPPTAVRDLTPSWMLTFDSTDPLGQNPDYGVYTSGGAVYPTGWSRICMLSGQNSRNNGPGAYLFMPQWPKVDSTGNYKRTADTVRFLECAYGDTRVTGALQSVPDSFYIPHKYYFDSSIRSAHTLRGNTKLVRYAYDNICIGSTADYLTNAHLANTNLYYSNTNYLGGTNALKDLPGGGNACFPHVASSTDFDNNDTYWSSNTSWVKLQRKFGAVWTSGGDFDNGCVFLADGPYINKPNEGTQQPGTFAYPDFAPQGYSSYAATFMPPNRQVSSPVMFGSLPVFIDANNAATLSSLTADNAYFWRTLLFCPNPNSPSHPSLQSPSGAYPGAAQNPPDYALLDFFNMPVVEPYAISEPFSAAGRVNMNYQIAPFTYIKRDAAMRGVLRSTMMTAVPDSWMGYYKSSNYAGYGDNGGAYDQAAKASNSAVFRYPIHPTETLKQFDAKFAAGGIFKSPSEICSIWLYPASQPTDAAPEKAATPLVSYDANLADIKSWWYDNAGGTDVSGMKSRKSLTGDNMRERPYATLYPQLTTKSNSYTVHYRVQVLKQVPGIRSGADAWKTWKEGKDQVVGEYRGATLIERYVDPANAKLPDFATAASGTDTLDNYYNFRVISARRFAP